MFIQSKHDFGCKGESHLELLGKYVSTSINSDVQNAIIHLNLHVHTSSVYSLELVSKLKIG